MSETELKIKFNCRNNLIVPKIKLFLQLNLKIVL